jgi:hypothetical protein
MQGNPHADCTFVSGSSGAPDGALGETVARLAAHDEELRVGFVEEDRGVEPRLDDVVRADVRDSLANLTIVPRAPGASGTKLCRSGTRYVAPDSAPQDAISGVFTALPRTLMGEQPSSDATTLPQAHKLRHRSHDDPT